MDYRLCQRGIQKPPLSSELLSPFDVIQAATSITAANETQADRWLRWQSKLTAWGGGKIGEFCIPG